MRWRLQRLQVLLAPVLLSVGEKRGRREQREQREQLGRGVRQPRKAALVASWFVRGIHVCPSAVTHANPKNR